MRRRTHRNIHDHVQIDGVRRYESVMFEFDEARRAVAELAAALERSFSEVYSLEARPLPPETLDRGRLEELTAENRSWLWLWGRKVPFTWEARGRFPWGEVAVCLAVEAGRVREAAVYTDAIDWSFANPMGEALTGCLFALGQLQEAVDSVPCDGAVQRDISSLLAARF